MKKFIQSFMLIAALPLCERFQQNKDIFLYTPEKEETHKVKRQEKNPNGFILRSPLQVREHPVGDTTFSTAYFAAHGLINREYPGVL